MDDKNIDVFQVSKKNPFDNSNEDNFFIQGNPKEIQLYNEPTRRLNDYDRNLLEEGAYKDVTDDLFKLEYKISKIEEELKILDSQIVSAKEILDINLMANLENRKQILIKEHQELVELYNNKSLSARISDSISNIFTPIFKPMSSTKSVGVNRVQKKINQIKQKLETKLPKKLLSAFELRKSLNKLENINKSVDELVSMNSPYGENFDKYEQLSKYISKANTIQNEISKFIK